MTAKGFGLLVTKHYIFRVTNLFSSRVGVKLKSQVSIQSKKIFLAKG